MSRTRASVAIVGMSFLFLCLSSSAQKKSHSWNYRSADSVQIPGATRVGSEACTACHSEVASNFRHAYHAQQGIECEDCHGAGSLHVESGGDVTKIVSYRKRDARNANGACLSCHAQDESVRNWMAGPHASNSVRCTDCHQIHSHGARSESITKASLDVMTPGRVAAVENLVPEAKVFTQPLWQANDACMRCHQTQAGQMSLPYHHPLREGKMKCGDCHDPHGGPGGNNLRGASVNQLCLSCHSQYRGPFAYQHPPVTENCMLCHTAHGSPNTNLLSVSEPALCLQCHAGHHDGAGLPLTDRCTNCHPSIHGTDVATPSGGSRFVDKGPYGVPSEPPQAPVPVGSSTALTSSRLKTPAASQVPTFAAGFGTGALGMMSSEYLRSQSGGNALSGTTDPEETPADNTYAAYSITPGSYRFVDTTGFGGRVGEYDTLQQSAGADTAASYVSLPNHITVVSRGNLLTDEDYQAASQVTIGKWAQFGFDMRSFVQQQDHYNFYAFPVLDIPPGSTTPPDTTTDLIPGHASFAAKRRLGNAYGRVKVTKLPVHLFVKGSWQARVGETQLTYLDENTTPAVYQNSVNTTCGAQCHYISQFQPVNYTTRNVGGGFDVKLHNMILTWEHTFSSFNDRLTFPIGTYTGPFTPENEGYSVINPPPSGPAPLDFPAGNYYLDIPSPNQASADRVSLNWTVSPKLSFDGNLIYTRLHNTFTQHSQNAFDSDETLNWRPIDRLRVTADYHQQNVINDFTPYYSLFGDVSYHNHSEGLRLDYELPKGFDVETYYRRSGITRSNAFLWPQIYSMDNTDLLPVVPSSVSNTTGLAFRYHDRERWSARAGYEWTGTNNPGYLIIPQSNNRVFANVSFTPVSWLIFTNDTNIIVQNAFADVALPNSPNETPGFGTDITGLTAAFQRRNRFFYETASATLPVLPNWDLGFGYSYQQNNLTTYMAFQNDSSVGYVVDDPAVPYKQIVQAYWGESSYTLKQRLGLNLRVTYNSARSGFRPDVNPNDAAQLGNQFLISSGAFDPVMFSAALNNLQFAATQISQVIVPQWIGQSKIYYRLPYKLEGGLIFYYGSYRDYWNPNLNGVLRTFNVYLGRSW